jgi:hypothetical protein
LYEGLGGEAVVIAHTKREILKNSAVNDLNLR